MNKYLFNESTMTADNMISASQILAWLKCRKNWGYGYIDKLKRRVERPFLTIGKLCHVGMAAAWTEHYAQMCHFIVLGINADKAAVDLEKCVDMGYRAIQLEYDKYMSENTFLEDEIPIQEQLRYDSLIIFRNAFLRFEPEKWEVATVPGTKKGEKPVPAIELHFRIPFAGYRGLHGFIDAVLINKETGQMYSVDYKFQKSLGNEEEEAYNLQNAIYMYVTRKIGLETVGTITYRHLNTPPSLPSINKNGTISRAKIKTDWQTYAAFCEANGQNPAEYAEDMYPKLAEIEWVKPVYEYRNDETMERIWNSVVVAAAREIKAKNKRLTPSMYPWNCKMCSFAELCQGELRGYDMGYLKNSVYTSKTARDFVTENTDAEDKDILDVANTPIV